MMEQFEHGGNIHRAARENAARGAWLDFSANINPLGLSAQVRAAVEREIGAVVHYPDPEGIALKEALVGVYGVDASLLTLGNGAAELLYVLCHVLRPRRVLIPAPSFSEYERAARAAGAEVRYHLLSAKEEFRLDLSKLFQDMASCDMLFLGNPNNPTGTLLTAETIRAILARAASAGVFVVADESFLDFLPDDAAYTAKPLLAAAEHLLVLHSLTKFYAIPGLRLGFAAAAASLTEKLHLAKDPWNVNSLAQAAGVAALADAEYRRESRRFLAAERAAFCRRLADFPMLKAYPPAVNFVLVDLSAAGLSSRTLRALCREEGILIRDCANYPGLNENYARFAIKSTAENERLFAVLKKIFSGWRK